MYRSAEELIAEAAALYKELLDLFSGVNLVDREIPGAEGAVETISEPSIEQIDKAEELYERYLHWCRIVSAFLARINGVNRGEFDEYADNLMSYFLFHRSGADVSHDVWRVLFVRESQQLLNRQIQMIHSNSDEFFHADSASAKFMDFDVKIARRNDAYTLEIRTLFGAAESSFTLPHESRDVENFVLRYCNPRGVTRRAIPTSVVPFSKFGKRLFDSLITDRSRDLYSSLRAHARANRLGVRIRLRFNELPEISRIPWEFMFDGTDFFCLEPRSTLVRHLDSHMAPPPLDIGLPLRVLVTIASPPDLPELDVQSETERLKVALGPYLEMGAIDLSFTRDGQLPTLQRALALAERSGRSYHIWHFIGHGIFDENDATGYLAFASSYGSRKVSGFEVGTLFRNYESLRLILMNACETAASDDVDAMSGIAGALIERGVPTVVAMQFPVSDAAAISFAGEFYASIAAGSPVDSAVTDARRTIFFHPNYSEWATPVVFTRTDNSDVFNIIQSD